MGRPIGRCKDRPFWTLVAARLSKVIPPERSNGSKFLLQRHSLSDTPVLLGRRAEGVLSPVEKLLPTVLRTLLCFRENIARKQKVISLCSYLKLISIIPDDIIYDIMDQAKLKRILAELERLRERGCKGVKSRELENLATSLGRQQHKRGKEPTWVHETLDRMPISIPNHGGKDLNRFTARNIINSLEADVEAWEERIKAEEHEDHGD